MSSDEEPFHTPIMVVVSRCTLRNLLKYVVLEVKAPFRKNLHETVWHGTGSGKRLRLCDHYRYRQCHCEASRVERPLRVKRGRMAKDLGLADGVGGLDGAEPS